MKSSINIKLIGYSNCVIALNSMDEFIALSDKLKKIQDILANGCKEIDASLFIHEKVGNISATF